MDLRSRASVLLLGSLALVWVATESHIGVLLAIAWPTPSVVVLTHLRVPDTSRRMFGPVWFRRALAVSAALLWVAIPLLS